jgi:hypothetical protein
MGWFSKQHDRIKDEGGYGWLAARAVGARGGIIGALAVGAAQLAVDKITEHQRQAAFEAKMAAKKQR